MNSKITDTIKQDLIILFQSVENLPFNLTLGSIAEYYSVSLTPVRQVIGELVLENILTRKPNGRLERRAQDNPLEPVAINKQASVNLSPSLDEQVKAYVIQLSLQNHSDYLREQATAEKFQSGRTIIRQVFSRLAGAGFLEHVPRCGWKVTSIREKDMSDYLTIREILELKALKLARPYFRKRDLKALLDVNVASSNPLLASLDNDLHNYWIRLSDNRYIQDFFNRHGTFYTAVFEYASIGKEVISEMAQEHRDILENLLAENWSQAEKALVRHIRAQKQNLLEQLQFRNSTRNARF